MIQCYSEVQIITDNSLYIWIIRQIFTTFVLYFKQQLKIYNYAKT